MAQPLLLDAWIDALRDRLASGALASLGPLDIGDGTLGLPGETTIRIMLADLADVDHPEGWDGRKDAERAERRRALLSDFGRLRALLG